MRVLLLNPPSEKGFIRTGRWVRKSRANQQWYPIWLAYCAGFLQKHGYEVELYDASAMGTSYDAVYMFVKILEPEVVVYYWCYDNMKDDLDFANLLAKFSRVILVGPWSLCAPDALKHASRIRVMTYGEFEHTVLELLQKYDYRNIKGVIWKDHHNGQITTNASRPLCSSAELDEMPLVTKVYKQFLDLKQYRQTSFKYPFVDLFTARGCPNRCSYCVWTRAFQGGASYRVRSVENVVNEMKYIQHSLSAKQVFFQDDTMVQKRAVELSQAFIDNRIYVPWGCYSRAELDYETLKEMKDSGCRTLHVGYESPIQTNLDLINKDLTVEQMKEFADNVKKLGMWSSATFMIFPWMTKKDVKFTIKWAKSIKPKRMNFIQAQGYPNTPYAELLKKFSEHPDTLPFDEKLIELMSFEEMKKWEQWGFKQFYIYNSRFWCEVLRHPSEWRNVVRDAGGLLRFLRS